MKQTRPNSYYILICQSSTGDLVTHIERVAAKAKISFVLCSESTFVTNMFVFGTMSYTCTFVTVNMKAE